MSDILNIAEDIVSIAKSKGASADVQIVKTESRECIFRMNSTEKEEESMHSLANMRIILGQKQSFISSTNIASINYRKDIEELVENAINMAKASPDDPYIGLEDSKIDSLQNISDVELPEFEWLIHRAKAIEENCLENKWITNSEGVSVNAQNTQIFYCNSLGNSSQYSNQSTSYYAQFIAGEDLEMQSEWNYFITTCKDKLPSAKSFASEIAENLQKNLILKNW